MNFRTISDLNRCVVHSLWKVPRDVDLIVGVPRSGFLAASVMALHLNLPLTDVDGFLAGRIFESGRTRRRPDQPTHVAECRRALILDDSVNSGRTIEQVRAKVADASPMTEVLYAAVFATPNAVNLVDLYFDLCPKPRIFEWNFMHHAQLKNFCLDIDGVLCRDPTAKENDDGPRYATFLREAQPLFLPSKPVGTLVTSRLEKYRSETEDWMHRHGVQFDRLIMMDYPSKAARIAAGRYGAFKADVYRETGASLFIESNPKQAAEIANRSGKPVFCVGAHQLFHPVLLDGRSLLYRIRGRLGRKGRTILRAFRSSTKTSKPNGTT